MTGIGGLGGSGGVTPFANQPGDTMSSQDQAAVKNLMSQMGKLDVGGFVQTLEGKLGFFSGQSPGEFIKSMNEVLADVNSIAKSFTELTGWNGSLSSPRFSRDSEYPSSSPMNQFINQIIGSSGAGQSDGPLGGFLAAKPVLEKWVSVLRSKPADGPPFYTLDPDSKGNGDSSTNPIPLMQSVRGYQFGNSLATFLGGAGFCGAQLAEGVKIAAEQFFPADFPKG